jgi:tRNA threonylcarbamoyladenosine biosynthesis protein TsaB
MALPSPRSELRLVIETATPACSIAMLDGVDVIAGRHEVVGRGHAERLVPMIGDMINEVGATPGSILVDCGPGSFTGLRVGLAAARALGLAWSVPVHGCSSLALIAARTLADGDIAECGVALIGGHGELFVQAFSGDPLRPLDELASLVPEAAATALSAAVIAGSGATALVAARGWGEARDVLPSAADARLLPEALAALPPRPIYGRAPDAKPKP